MRISLREYSVMPSGSFDKQCATPKKCRENRRPFARFEQNRHGIVRSLHRENRRVVQIAWPGIADKIIVHCQVRLSRIDFGEAVARAMAVSQTP